MSQPNWRTEEKQPEFGEKIFAEVDWGKYVVIKAIEGKHFDCGICAIAYLDEDENFLDDIEIVRWVPLSEILGE